MCENGFSHATGVRVILYHWLCIVNMFPISCFFLDGPHLPLQSPFFLLSSLEGHLEVHFLPDRRCSGAHHKVSPTQLWFIPPPWSMNVNDTKPPLIRIVSHNVLGINSPIKRRKLFKLYQSQKSDILLLQETHFPGTYNPSFLHQHFPLFFLSNAENKTKGVTICFSKHLNFAMYLGTHQADTFWLRAP